jgi:hypothetical protein
MGAGLYGYFPNNLPGSPEDISSEHLSAAACHPVSLIIYPTFSLSAGLTLGTISALFSLNHGIIDQSQYSHLVATVIGSAVVPTAIANAYFMPKYLLPKSETSVTAAAPVVVAAKEAP